MRFLNSRYSQQTTLDTIDSIQLQREPVSDLIPEENLQNTSKISLMASTNLMSKFYRFQTLTDREPPETFYENEAWAPNNEGVGFFHKHRMKDE